MKRLPVIAGLFGLLSCGGDSNPCPTGSCTLPGNTIVKFTFDAYPNLMPPFPMDSCTDFGALKVQVDMTGAGSGSSQVVDCGESQATFTGLDEGDYTVAVTPQGAGGASLVTAPVSAMVTAMGPGTTATTTVNVPWDSWTGTHTGTFLFRLSWGGKTCAMATPPVVTQRLTLTVNGQAVTGVTEQGMTPLNGVGSAGCYPLESNFPDDAKTVPFGPATLRVVGLDGSGSAAFDHTFDTFIGAGISNPTLTYDLPGAGSGSGSGSGSGV